jgi:hypothetical protein
LNLSPVRDLEQAVGQYSVYEAILKNTEPHRKLFLAVPRRVYEGLLLESFGQLIIDELKVRLVVFDEKQERIVQWKS